MLVFHFESFSGKTRTNMRMERIIWVPNGGEIGS